MDKDTLISEIYKRVKEKLDNAELKIGNPCKPRLLVLTDRHGDTCHKVLECPGLQEHYQLECALLKEYQCDINEYEAVIAFTLSNEALGKIAAGIFDSSYTRLFGQAILSGKKIYLPKEEVELYQYRETAPAVYYKQLAAKLKLLQDSGIVILPGEELPSGILTGISGMQINTADEAAGSYGDGVSESEIILEKHIITERDIMAVRTQRGSVVVVNNKAILTDLAKEFANKQGIGVRRRDLSSIGKGGGL